jgi:hypothetical protein
MYRAGLLRVVVEAISKYKLDLLGVQKSDETEVAPKQQSNIHFSMGRGIRIMN